jgi:hypothetical protein
LACGPADSANAEAEIVASEPHAEVQTRLDRGIHLGDNPELDRPAQDVQMPQMFS